MNSISSFLVLWHKQLYMSWDHIIFRLYLYFLNDVLYFFKYSCTNIFHRRSLYTFYYYQNGMIWFSILVEYVWSYDRLHKGWTRRTVIGHVNACIYTITVLSSSHWGRDQMADIFQTTFSNAFSWMKIFEFWIIFHWSLFLRVQLTIFQHWFR